MSTFQALALILATSLFGLHLILIMGKMTETQSHIILTGVYNGVSLSTEHREMVVWTYYWSTMIAAMLTQVLLAVDFVLIGKNVAEPAVQLLAYVSAGVFCAGTLLWLAATIFGLIQFTSVLRKTRKA